MALTFPKNIFLMLVWMIFSVIVLAFLLIEFISVRYYNLAYITMLCVLVHIIFDIIFIINDKEGKLWIPIIPLVLCILIIVFSIYILYKRDALPFISSSTPAGFLPI